MCNRYELCLRFIYTGIYTCNFYVEIINYLHRKNSMVNRQIVNVEKLVGSWVSIGVYFETLFEVKMDKDQSCKSTSGWPLKSSS